MQKTKVLTGLVLSVLVLGGTSSASVFAATSKSVETTGKVIFEQVKDDDEGEVTKPGTEEEIIAPEGGGKTAGPLRITHVPDFDFGTIEIQTKTLETPAKFMTFKEIDDNGVGTGSAKDIAHFVQVEDIRGKQGDWELTLKSSKFVPSKASNKTLAKSHIILTESKLFNTALVESEIANRLEPIKQQLTITNDNQDISLLKTKAGAHTDTSKTSLVFNKQYTQDDLVGGVPNPAVGKSAYNPGVQLKAFGTDEKVVDDTYTATLTWTLKSAL